MSEPLALAEVRAELRPAVAPWTLLWYPELDSTQEELRRQAAAGAAAGTVILAETQTAGRGRRGRVWRDRAEQDLLFSALLEAPGVPPGLLPVALGAGLAQALAELTGAEIMAKWPNDLVAAGAKLGGLLVELSGGRYLAGLGLNVLGPEELAPRAGRAATTLEAAAGRSLRREPVLAAGLNAMEAVCREWSPEKRAEVVAERDYLRGRQIVVCGPQGELRGVAAGIGPSGALLVRHEAETVEVLVADAVKVEADAQ
jgi:BirA family transcriptional regulator, biotin operon repressor / biotin---[acetyl-CoA-carboxylase] ligase